MSGKNILLVDDSRTVLAFHSRILKQAGFECQTAENGYVALERLLSSHFDLIVTDVNMPKMDGYSLVAKVRALEEYAATPIIMVSTESEDHDMVRGLEAGASCYLFKPVASDILLAQVDMLLKMNHKSVG